VRTSFLLVLAACADTETPADAHPEEVITTVVLDFVPDSGEPITARWADPENDGSPVIDPIPLALGTAYRTTVRLLNELEDPPEEITDEVAAESDEHQLFFLGSAIGTVLEHAYADTDDAGLPVGLESDVTAVAAGSGDLVVALRHLPVENGSAQKVDGLAGQAAAEGLSSLPGTTDAEVTFQVTVE
jgi:hypothetical protein